MNTLEKIKSMSDYDRKLILVLLSITDEEIVNSAIKAIQE